MPMVAFPPGMPFTSHAMAVPAGVQKNAVRDCELPKETFAAGGEREFAPEHVIVTFELADFALSATLAAVTVTGSVGAGVAGAI